MTSGGAASTCSAHWARSFSIRGQFALRGGLLGKDVLQLAIGLAQRELRLAQGAVEVGITLALGAHGTFAFIEPRLGTRHQHANAAQAITDFLDALVGGHLALAFAFFLFGQFGQLLGDTFLLFLVALDGLRHFQHVHLHDMYALLAVGDVLPNLAHFFLFVFELFGEQGQLLAAALGLLLGQGNAFGQRLDLALAFEQAMLALTGGKESHAAAGQQIAAARHDLRAFRQFDCVAPKRRPANRRSGCRPATRPAQRARLHRYSECGQPGSRPGRYRPRPGRPNRPER